MKKYILLLTLLLSGLAFAVEPKFNDNFNLKGNMKKLFKLKNEMKNLIDNG